MVAIALSGIACSTAAERPDPHRTPRVLIHPDGTELRELRVVFHIHTKFSHDSDGSIGEVFDAAVATGCDALVITDHDRRDAWVHQGVHNWKGRPLLAIVGVEYSTRLGHLIDVYPRELYPPKAPVQELIDTIRAAGGMTIAAHPTGDKRPWQDWSLSGIDGLEIYNVSSDHREDLPRIPGRLFSAILGRNDTVLASLDVPRATLNLWDREEMTGRRLVGIGAANAHGFELDARANFDAYENNFALMANRLWVRSFDEAGFREALAAGRSYVGFDALGDPAGFEFDFVREDGRWIVGDSVPPGARGTLRVRTPLPGRIELVRDGVRVRQVFGTELRLEGAGAGVWRVEVTRRDGRFGAWHPWILSNPIRVGRVER